jgi:hypothetical protein
MLPDVLRVRRAVRALLRQGGGIMLTRLPESGGHLRIECAVAGLRADLTVRCESSQALDAVRRAAAGVRAECERVGLDLGSLCVLPGREPAVATEIAEARELPVAA